MQVPQLNLSEIDSNNFLETAKSIFSYQLANNPIYLDYCKAIDATERRIKTIEDFPFLPISFFKSHQNLSGNQPIAITFESSGTTGQEVSKHHVFDISIYRESCRLNFERIYGSLQDFCILALLPSYLERDNSSLVYMVDYFMKLSGSSEDGFYLYDHSSLAKKLAELAMQKKKVLLIGVSFALLDFAEKFRIESNPNLIIMETGGMKGRKKEIIRADLHQQLKQAFQVEKIHSEYGMTELLSQAYAKKDGFFDCPKWMQVLIRQQDDPFAYCTAGQTGGINIIDLANIHSCAFIQTDDLGRKLGDQFEVLGRFDSAEVRGCNLMAIH